MTPRDTLIKLFKTGVAAVNGRRAVRAALSGPAPDRIIAVGKAAADMCLGAQDVFGHDIKALVVTKYGHATPGLSAQVIESSHPVPDQNSLNAGTAMLSAVADMPAGSRLLLLVSGGASALAEVLPDEMTLDDLQELTAGLVASGVDIAQINARRKSESCIKDGRLLAGFKGAHVTICAISDVQGGDIGTIGSGIGDPRRLAAPFDLHLVATNAVARMACAKAADLPVKNNVETLYDDVFTLAKSIAAHLKTAPNGVHIWGGESTIKLPPNPGLGGRNQALALALAREISGFEGLTILVAGTDGTDGPNDAAGAVINGATYGAGADDALKRADAGTYLRASNDILITGPTGTNVMDLVIALKV